MIDRPKIQLLLTKVITLYALFYMLVKIIGVFKGFWLVPNLIIAFFLLLLGLSGWRLLRQQKAPLYFVLLGIACMVLLRIYEVDLMLYLQGKFGN
jgi:hypothetical protein